MPETKKPSVFVIVLNYNGKQFLNPCLASIFQSDWPNLDVVVVDNNSIDGSFEAAKEKFSRVHFIKNSSNLGFSRGNNVGIRYALEQFADYVFLLNNDTLINNTTISDLVQAAEQTPDCAIFSPLILTSDRTNVWFSGGKINWLKMRAEHTLFEKKVTPYETEYLSGCAMLIRKKVFEKIGLFDERFFLYYEDVDFSLRAKRNSLGLCLIPSITIFHAEQSNKINPEKTYWLVLSALIFFRQHSSFLQRIWQILFLRLRKIKNFFTLKFKPNATALQVKKAYTDFAKIS